MKDSSELAPLESKVALEPRENTTTTTMIQKTIFVRKSLIGFIEKKIRYCVILRGFLILYDIYDILTDILKTKSSETNF